MSSSTDQKELEPTLGVSKNMPRKTFSIALFLKLLGLLIFVSMIFFGGLLAYIVLQPLEEVFFLNMFYINSDDAVTFLVQLINTTYFCISVVTSIIWITLIYHAFGVPKDLTRKQLLSWFLVGLIGLLLYLIVSFWGFLLHVVNSGIDTDDRNIILYDQASYAIDEFRGTSRIYNTENLIGPIDILFDIKLNATILARSNQYEFQGFEIDFDGAECNNGDSIIRGTNPMNDQSLICRFDKVKPYHITGNYTVKTRDGNTLTLPIKIPGVKIIGLVSIKQENRNNQQAITLDATNLKEIGSIEWVFEGGDTVKTGSVISLPLNQNSMRVCLKIVGISSCNRIFAFGKDN